MSKRIVRITGAHISSSIEDVLNKMVNVVLDNGETYLGNIHTHNPTEITLLDTRSHLHRFQIKDVYEILFDQTSRG